MRAVFLLLLFACGKHDAPTAKKIDEPPPAPPAPRPIAACDQLAAALAHADQLDTDDEVIELLRDQAALLRAATRAPRDADRAELTVRCTHGLMALAKIPHDSDMIGVGSISGGVVGGLANAPPPPPPPPPPHSTANAVPS